MKKSSLHYSTVGALSSSNVTPTNKDVKAFDIKIKEEDLKVIKEKLTQSLNKEAVFLSIAFQGSDMMKGGNIELIIWFNCGIMVGVGMKECYDENFELFVKF